MQWSDIFRTLRKKEKKQAHRVFIQQKYFQKQKQQNLKLLNYKDSIKRMKTRYTHKENF